jgi:hypothetical protein
MGGDGGEFKLMRANRGRSTPRGPAFFASQGCFRARRNLISQAFADEAEQAGENKKPAQFEKSACQRTMNGFEMPSIINPVVDT